MDRVPEWVALAAMLVLAAPVVLWMAGAIYYDVCGGGGWGALPPPGFSWSSRRSSCGSRRGSRSPRSPGS